MHKYELVSKWWIAVSCFHLCCVIDQPKLFNLLNYYFTVQGFWSITSSFIFNSHRLSSTWRNNSQVDQPAGSMKWSILTGKYKLFEHERVDMQVRQ